jgi:hypothetical protein
MRHRRVGSHQLNMESSRSHAIMTIYADATPTDPSALDYGTTRFGKISFVDLAGSERVKDSGTTGACALFFWLWVFVVVCVFCAGGGTCA